ncbi:MAG: SDR family NAD(P)-dependent oxidoreductase [Pseudomonadota bacterium]
MSDNASDQQPSSPIALITGSAKRLGRAMALGLAEDGFNLILHYHHSRDETETLCQEINAMGREAIAVPGDLADPADAASIVEAGCQAFGPLNLLINNASLFEQDRLESLTLESWRQLMDVNLTSPVFLMKAFAAQNDLPLDASIINMLDQQMATPSPAFLSYAVAKIGLEGATRLAAFELAPRIRVNGIAPGLVLPSWMQTEEKHRARQQMMPLGEGLGASDILKAVRYLVSARHVTGQVITVDSGQSLIGPGNSKLSPRTNP